MRCKLLAVVAVLCVTACGSDDLDSADEAPPKAADGSSSEGSSEEGAGADAEGEDDDDHDHHHEGDGGGFVPPPEGEGVTSCDPGTQDCPDGEKCTAYVSTPGYCCVDSNKCMPIIGDRQLGDSCTREAENDDCAAGLFCLTKTSGDTGPGRCMPFCDINDPNTCAEMHGLVDANCCVFNDGVLPWCEGDCDPLAQDCPDGSGCYQMANGMFACSVPKHDPGAGLDGDPCDSFDACAPGLRCAAKDEVVDCAGDSCCTPMCNCEDLESSPCSAVGEQCGCFFQDYPLPGFEQLGYCGVF